MVLFFVFQPKWSDLDMNHHVNNVKYVRWMLEVIKLCCIIHLIIAYSISILMKLIIMVVDLLDYS